MRGDFVLSLLMSPVIALTVGIPFKITLWQGASLAIALLFMFATISAIVHAEAIDNA